MDAFDIPETGRAAFRARIRNLQRLGLRPDAPGSGKRTQYSRSDIHDLALALSLADLGVDPSRVVEHVTPGTTAEIKKEKFCLYYPAWFTKGTGQIWFVSKKTVIDAVSKMPRFAVVSIDVLRFRVDAPLYAIEREIT